jgi:integrase
VSTQTIKLEGSELELFNEFRKQKEKKQVLSNMELLEEFKTKSRNLSKGSIKNYNSVARMFIKWLDGKHLFDISISDIEDYNIELNENPNLSLETKISRFNLTKRFVKKSYYRHLEEIGKKRDPLFVIKFIEFLDQPGEFSKKNDRIHSRGRDHVFMTLEELVLLLYELKIYDFTKYIIFRSYVETGARRKEILSMKLNYDIEDLPKSIRHLDTIEKQLAERIIYTPLGKTGRHIYYCSEELRDYLISHVEKRRNQTYECNALFLSSYKRFFSENAINDFLKRFIKKVNERENRTIINPNITMHSFRRTINNERMKMGCPNNMLKILVNQSVNDVNFKHYIDKSKGFLTEYDKYNPYKFVKL